MTTLNTWINFNGNAEEAFDFYRSVFGGDFSKTIRFRDLAGAEGQVAENEANKIMQIVLPLGNGSALVGNDVPEIMGKVNERENRSKIYLKAESMEEARRIFDGLSQGGEVEGPFGNSPWGTSAAMFRDKYGIEWIVESYLAE